MNISTIMQRAYETAKRNGFYDPDLDEADSRASLPTFLAGVQSELSEIFEDWRVRRNDWERRNHPNGKPLGIPSELADVVIRVCEWAEHHGVELEEAIEEKLSYNDTRPFRHGGKRG